MKPDPSHLESVEAWAAGGASLVDAIRGRAATVGDRLAYVFLDGDGEPARHLSYRDLDHRARGLGAALQSRLQAGDLVALLVDDEHSFVVRFWGCIYAGVVPVPLPAPKHPRDRSSLGRLRSVIDAAAIGHVLGDAIHQERAAAALSSHQGGPEWLLGDDLVERPAAWSPPDLSAGDTAFVQFTSGSTSSPRGAMITHGNAIHNVAFILDAFAYDELVAMSWLPLYHDMGLVGHVIFPVVGGGVGILMPNAAFLRDPLLWLEVISRFDVEISGAPPFAFDACVRHWQQSPRPIRLASWKTAYVGAQPVPRRTLRRFAETFADVGLDPSQLFPCYGLAEATLLVAGDHLADLADDGPVTYAIHPRHAEILIVDPATGRELAAGEDGEIVVRGKTVGAGYHGLVGDPSDSVFSAPDDGDAGRSVHTGDLGRMVDGRLQILGRRKDMIIVRGANLFSEDLEAAVLDSHPLLYGQACACVAGGTGDEADADADETVVALVEVATRRGGIDWPNLAEAAVGALTGAAGVAPESVVFLRRGLLPRTTSGKVSRARCRQLFAAGELTELARWHEGTLTTRRGPAGSTPTEAVASRDRGSDVAVIGMACRFPGGADSPEAFWALLEDGVDAISEVPAERWDLDEYYDPRPAIPGKMNTRFGGFIEGVDEFDGEFFGMSPVEAREVDPQQRLLLETTWRALEHAGVAVDSLAGSRVGVFIGVSTNDYLHLQIRNSTLESLNAYTGLGNANSICANRLSYLLDLHGPSLAVDTACSSSLTALHLAVESLQRGECDMAIAGGVNLMLSSGTTLLLSQFGMMSPTGRCHVFDEAADGYVRSEGCGIVVLKGVGDAVRDGDQVLACVCGSAMSQDGRSAGITAPQAEAQRMVIEAALRRARLPAGAVSLVEAHGTGTAVGDPVEVQELVAAYGPAGTAPCHVGSVKANVGHLEAAAGIASVIKLVLALQRRRIPPQIHLRSLHPQISLRGSRLEISTEAKEWELPTPAEAGAGRHAAVSSFGFGGTNVHAILREAHSDERPAVTSPADAPEEPQLPVLFPLSARSPEALRRLAADWGDFLDGRGDLSLAALATTQAVRRRHFDHRAACVVSSLDELRRALADGVDSDAWRRGEVQLGSTGSRVAFLYPGQGESRPGMGRRLYDTQPAFREAFDRCDSAFDGGSLADWLFASDEVVPESVQPGLFAVCFAMTQVWKSWGIEPHVVCGHSLGELVAATVAGCLTPENGMRLVAERARLMATVAAQGEMAAVLATPEAARQVAARHDVSLAAVNGPERVVLSGPSAAVGAALAELGGAARSLDVAQAFHSSLMDPILDDLERFALGIPTARPEITFVSTLTGSFVTSAPTAAHWKRHLRDPVLWADGVAKAEAAGSRMFLEVGPGSTLTALCRRLVEPAGSLCLPSLGRADDETSSMLDALGQLYAAGAPVDWRSVLPPSGWVAEAPGHPMSPRRYWFDDPPEAGGVAPRRRDSVADCAVFDVQWQPVPPPGKDPATAEISTRINWILLGDGDGGSREASLGFRLQERLGEHGGEVFWISKNPESAPRGSGFRKLSRALRGGRMHLEVARGCDAAGYYELLSYILHKASRDESTRWCVLYLDGLAAAGPTTVDSLRHDQDVHGVGDLTEWVKALAQTALYMPLWIVTRGAEPATAEAGGDPPPPPLSLAQAPLWGFAKTLFLEHAEMRGGLIDLDPGGNTGGDLERDAEWIWRQVLSNDRHDHVAYRGDQRFVARLVPRPSVAPTADPPLRLREDGVHVVTGGLGGLGLECGKWLARRGSRRIALLGRSLPPPRSEWGDLPADHPAAARVRGVGEIEALGCDVDLYEVDVTDPERLAACFAEIRSTAPVRGVLHAAGVNWFSRVIELDHQRLLTTLPIKVEAAWQLHELTADADLDCFVLFSSVSSLWGSAELSHYTAANHFLDALAHERRRQGLPATSIAWGPWGQVGMSSTDREREVLGQLGFQFLPPAEALGHMEERIANGPPLSAVMRVDWQVFEPFMTYAGGRALFDEVRTDREEEPADGPVDIRSLRTLPGEEARVQLLDLVIRQLGSVMQVGVTEQVDVHQRFNMMGMDSLTAIAFAARLESALGLPMPSALAYNHPNLAAVTDALLKRIRDVEPAADEAAATGTGGAETTETPQTTDTAETAETVETVETVEPGNWFHLNGHDAAPANRRLYCFPYAGSGASVFQGWGNGGSQLSRLARVVPVQLPGREERSGEEPISDIAELLARLGDLFEDHATGDDVFFGHSLGALVAYGLACELRRRGRPTPGLLILSGSGSPCAVEEPIHGLPDDEFVAMLRKRYPDVHDALDEAGVREAFLPLLRADIQLVESFAAMDEAPLPCPIRVLGADDDPLAPRDDLLGWAAATRADFSLRLFSGGHLFVRDRREEVQSEIARYLGDGSRGNRAATAAP